MTKDTKYAIAVLLLLVGIVISFSMLFMPVDFTGCTTILGASWRFLTTHWPWALALVAVQIGARLFIP